MNSLDIIIGKRQKINAFSPVVATVTADDPHAPVVSATTRPTAKETSTRHSGSDGGCVAAGLGCASRHHPTSNSLVADGHAVEGCRMSPGRVDGRVVGRERVCKMGSGRGGE